MDPQEVKECLANTGWEIDDGFSGYLTIGCSGNHLSVVSRQEAPDVDEPIFELLDHLNNLSYWVKEIPTPRRAQELLKKYGKPPEEWE